MSLESCINNSLTSEERVIATTRVSREYLYKVPALILLAGYCIGNAFSHTGVYFGYYLFGVLVFGVPVIFRGMLAEKTTIMALTNRRVITKMGLFRHEYVEFYLNRIESIQTDTTMLGRRLGYGNIFIRGTGGDCVRFNGVSHPEEFKRSINEAMFSGKN